jgi:hypothetical protein
MPKFLRLLAVLLFVATAFSARLAAFPQPIPMCYSYLPHYGYPDPSWTYSHQCYEGTTVWNVYIDFKGNWKLCSSNILP